MSQAVRAPPPVARQPVAVVIVAHNSGPALAATVASALAERPVEVVVVDNASTDCSTAFLAGADARVQWLRQPRNVGFAEACNLGVVASSAPWVLLLNDDALLRPGYLATLRRVLEAEPKAASAIGKVIYRTGGVQYVDSAGVRLVTYALRPQDIGQDAVDIGQYDRPGIVFGPTGAAALYRRSAWQAAGGMDGALFAYYEDVDLAWRLNRAGWHHRYVPAAVAEHRRRGPVGKPAAIEARAFVNRYQVWAANASAASFCTYAPVGLAWEAVRLTRIGWRRPALLAGVLRRAPAAVWRGLRRRGVVAAPPAL